jgi:antirestriction protein ArdC
MPLILLCDDGTFPHMSKRLFLYTWRNLGMSNTAAYEKVTAAIVEALQQGVVPWRKPWTGIVPMNGESHRPYGGINSLVLGCAPYRDPRWLTWNGVQRLGGKVRKGERARPVVFWKLWEQRDRTTGEVVERVPLLRYFSVFNVEQCEGLALKPLSALIPTANHDPIAAAEAIIVNMPQRPVIEHGHAQAWYRPSTDLVGMPDRARFHRVEAYYSTLYHELAHSTGHKSRLNREEVAAGSFFGSEDYSREELVAEFTAAFLGHHAGIDSTREQSAAYLGSWLRSLQNDVKMAVHAAGRAQRAADFILGVSGDDTDTPTEPDADVTPEPDRLMA